MDETVIDLLRHGEPKGGRMYRGHRIDDPLTARGWMQMAAGVGEYRAWDRIITSPLRRCRDFADALGKELKIGVDVNHALREIGFGAWEGKTKDQLRAERPDEFYAFYRDPVANTPENAEPVLHFHRRIGQAMDEIWRLHEGKNVLVVAHAGVIRAALVHGLGAPVGSMYRIDVRNGRVSRIIRRAEQTVVELLNGRL